MGAGIRKWPKEYLPSIFDEQRVDQVMEISQGEAEETMRSLARVEGEGLHYSSWITITPATSGISVRDGGDDLLFGAHEIQGFDFSLLTFLTVLSLTQHLLYVLQLALAAKISVGSQYQLAESAGSDSHANV
jgi:cysteine synthase